MRWREPRINLYDEAVSFRPVAVRELDRGRIDRAVRSCAMRYEDLPESGNIEDRRDQSGSVGGGFPGGGIPLGRGGGLGIGTIVVLGLIGWALGIDPRLLIGGAEMVSRQNTQFHGSAQPGKKGAPTDETGRFVSRILGSTDTVWKDIFASDGRTYRPP